MWLVSRQLHDKIDAVYDVSVFYDGTVNKQGIRGNAPQLIGKIRCTGMLIKSDMRSLGNSL